MAANVQSPVSIYGDGDFHYKDKIVVAPSYFYNGNSYTGQKTSLYLDEHLNPDVTR